MVDAKEIKQKYLAAKEELFRNPELLKEPFRFCSDFSALVENFIYQAISDFGLNCALVAAGSFSRRELSPHSDVDVLFIFDEAEGNDDNIGSYITRLWDCGLEISHTVRQFSDIEKFRDVDLHAFTQFFETRFLLGNRKLYQEWNKRLIASLLPEKKVEILKRFFDDNKARYKKFGESPKLLEPNIKFTAGGMRDVHVVEWMYSFKNEIILTDQSEETQTEKFLSILKNKMLLSRGEINKLEKSYKLLLKTRNILHLTNKKKNDRLEFVAQEKIAAEIDEFGGDWKKFMKAYFAAAGVIYRFSRTMLKRFREQINAKISDQLLVELDEDFSLRGDKIIITSNKELVFQNILRAFYYRGKYGASFDEYLRSMIIDAINSIEEKSEHVQISSVFFREILNLEENVGKTLTAMSELGVLQLYLPEFKDLIGFFQPGVYHCYTADEHTLIAMINVENLCSEDSFMGRFYCLIKRRDLLLLSILLHDIGKPISVSGHEIIGAEIASTIMERLGYDLEEIELVRFLVRNHLVMEQTAFRRNLNDPATLNKFASSFDSLEALDLLYLLTFADLSAVSPVIWTQWKSDLLFELYSKTKKMISERLSGAELLSEKEDEAIAAIENGNNSLLKEHIDLINDLGYLKEFSSEEIADHVRKIEHGLDVEIFFKELSSFTNITIIAKDSFNLLARLCGALAINDINIHDAKIFTRKDGVIIDTFNVTEFRSDKLIDEEKYEKIGGDIKLAVANELALQKEFLKVKTKWKRIENLFFSKSGKIKVEFEKHDKYTIIDVYAPDKLGLLYQITQIFTSLGLSIYFAKISTKEDGVVDSFYVLDGRGYKVSSKEFELIRYELTEAIENML
ncbi:MAG: HD domain-containing protein [Chlorobi bacterium]|nr:HD domain-containing protein [Chlorobiota bacterium]